ncbi:MAG: bifunctional UDP-N-acetylmuramoyl-tripeptide:D-alanyl-D-alanine ligase/alanine racemase, partial [Bacteroidales bacterium]|nr:bifunctional UDP-N-acetylmuramoyl-tripeptide:D-alanyl-D-alanine ligase/alanine racemase [Bacteroidales bacterium]
MSYSIDLIEEIISAERIGNATASIKWLLTDSRSLCFPEETLFFALVTIRNSGASYIGNLYERGVKNFVISSQEKDLIERIRKGDLFSQANFLLVESPLTALQRLAEKHREQFNIPVVGITGSNGKTVVKEWIHHLLSPTKVVVRSPRSYNSQIGVPLSIWQMEERSEVAVFEAGISQMGEMEALHNMIKPTIGVLTNIGGAHQKNFNSLQEKCLEKLTLFKDCDVIIYNGDDELVTDCVARLILSTREIAWSRKDSEKPLYISRVVQKNDHTEITYSYLGLKNSFTIPFVDEASIENALHSLAVALYLIISPEQIAQQMAKLEPVAMRLEVKKGKNDTFIINDSYNSDLASLDIALDFLYRRSQKQGLKRTLILSDIIDSGQNTSALYQRVAQLIKSRKVDRIVGVGSMISSSEARFMLDKKFYPDTTSLLNAIEKKEISFRQEALLIKGARQFQFDLISDLLEEQVHETILEVDLKAMIDNLNHYRSMLTRSTRVIGMIKASAYGSGSYEIAKTLQEHHVDYLAVAVADEGYELRKGGITVPIMVMNPEFSSFKTLFNYNLEPEVYSFHLLESLIKAAKKEGITNFPIHVKIDTGMRRLGFDPSEMPQLVEYLQTQDAVIPRSVFSHLVGSDSAAFDDFTHKQITLFNES